MEKSCGLLYLIFLQVAFGIVVWTSSISCGRPQIDTTCALPLGRPHLLMTPTPFDDSTRKNSHGSTNTVSLFFFKKKSRFNLLLVLLLRHTDFPRCCLLRLMTVARMQILVVVVVICVCKHLISPYKLSATVRCCFRFECGFVWLSGVLVTPGRCVFVLCSAWRNASMKMLNG